jgi:hypothetical protein
MTPHLDPAVLAEAGQQLARVDALPSNTGGTRRLGIGLRVAVRHALPTRPVPPQPVAHRSVIGISGPNTRTALLDEIHVDSGLGACTTHTMLPGPGGAS